jgi:hypothetical protein
VKIDLKRSRATRLATERAANFLVDQLRFAETVEQAVVTNKYGDMAAVFGAGAGALLAAGAVAVAVAGTVLAESSVRAVQDLRRAKSEPGFGVSGQMVLAATSQRLFIIHAGSLRNISKWILVDAFEHRDLSVSIAKPRLQATPFDLRIVVQRNGFDPVTFAGVADGLHLVAEAVNTPR